MVSWILLSLLGGLWFPLDSFPAAVRFLSHLLPTYHYGVAARSVLTGGHPSLGNIAVLAAWLVAFGLVIGRLYRRREVWAAA